MPTPTSESPDGDVAAPPVNASSDAPPGNALPGDALPGDVPPPGNAPVDKRKRKRTYDME